LTAKFIRHFSPIVPLSLLEVSRVVDGVGGSWRYKRELLKPGLYNKPAGCSTSGAIATGTQKKKKKKRKPYYSGSLNQLLW
jgi:hypothetical protein